MRIEITNLEETPRAVDIDFEYGTILVNLTFTEKDLQRLQAVIAEALEGWEAGRK